MATRLSTAVVRQMLRKHMPGREAEQIVQVIDALNTDLTTAETTAATFKSAFNTLVAKLNADAGVTDTNYAAIP
jgi:alkyl hydroperoxide reductase subunit AhpC